jgi:hypothetical protein
MIDFSDELKRSLCAPARIVLERYLRRLYSGVDDVDLAGKVVEDDPGAESRPFRDGLDRRLFEANVREQLTGCFYDALFASHRVLDISRSHDTSFSAGLVVKSYYDKNVLSNKKNPHGFFLRS